MFSKIFFFLVIVCVVNASVLTVNVFDEDPKDEVASSPKDCNPQACDQLCHRLKFSGGACVKGRCKCDNFLNVEDEIPAEEYSDLEDMVSQNDDPEAEVAANPTRCRDRACNWLCRALNNTSGACVGGRCKCIKSVVAEVSEDLEDSATPKRCTPQACNNRCRGFGFREGVCTGSRCSCISFVLTPKDAMNDLEESISIDDDFLNDNFFNTEGIDELSEELPVSESSEDQNERGCNPRVCDQLCRRLKFKGGACVNGRCKCDRFFGTEVDAAEEYSELDTRRGCRITKCNRTCTRLGYDSAACVNRRCKCYNKTQDASPLNDVTSDDNEESNEILGTNEEELTDALPRRCNTTFCNDMCHRRGHAGGRCRFDQCQCF